MLGCFKCRIAGTVDWDTHGMAHGRPESLSRTPLKCWRQLVDRTIMSYRANRFKTTPNIKASASCFQVRNAYKSMVEENYPSKVLALWTLPAKKRTYETWTKLVNKRRWLHAKKPRQLIHFFGGSNINLWLKVVDYVKNEELEPRKKKKKERLDIQTEFKP